VNTKLGLTLFSTLKVIGHLLVAFLVTGAIAFFSHDPRFVFYMPLVNIVTAAIIKYFSITPDEMGINGMAPPQE
jgi:hypothetical protein